MTGKTKIELKGVKKRFGPKVVLDGVDLIVEEGESLVIIGGSGSGKSVTIKCVLGILRPDEGTILVDGEDVTHLSGSKRDAYLRKFGMLFQGGALFDSLPVWENVAFGLIQGRGMARAKAHDIAIEKLARVGLGSEVANLSPAELSGGMQKRVGLARAIALRPKYLLYDEPTTGLDPVTSAVIDDLMLRMQKTLGVTSVVITHDMRSAYRVGTRIALLHEGKVRQVGTVEEIQHTTDPIVRQFIEGRAEIDGAAA